MSGGPRGAAACTRTRCTGIGRPTFELKKEQKNTLFIYLFYLCFLLKTFGEIIHFFFFPVLVFIDSKGNHES